MQTPRAPRRVTPGARPARPAWRRWRPVGLAWALWALAMLSVPMAAWLDHLLRQAGRPDLLELTPTAIPPVLGAVSAATVGAVLATRRPRHPVGWLLLALGLSLSASGPAEAYTNYAVASPGAPPAASLVALYMPATVVAAFAAPSASSCGGWRWPRSWCRCCSWWSWPPWRWRPLPWPHWRRVSAWRCCRWRSARRSCVTGCTTWTASSAAR